MSSRPSAARRESRDPCTPVSAVGSPNPNGNSVVWVPGLQRTTSCCAAPGMTAELLAKPSLYRTDACQHRQQVADEPLRILAHGKMPEPLHDDGLGAGAARHVERTFGRARIIVFAGEQEQRAAFCVDQIDAVADVAVDLVEIEVALEHARAALHVVPQRLPALGCG